MNERRVDGERIASVETNVEHIKKSVDKIEKAVIGKNGLAEQTNSNKWRIRGAYLWLSAFTAGALLWLKEFGLK